MQRTALALGGSCVSHQPKASPAPAQRILGLIVFLLFAPWVHKDRRSSFSRSHRAATTTYLDTVFRKLASGLWLGLAWLASLSALAGASKERRRQKAAKVNGLGAHSGGGARVSRLAQPVSQPSRITKQQQQQPTPPGRQQTAKRKEKKKKRKKKKGDGAALPAREGRWRHAGAREIERSGRVGTWRIEMPVALLLYRWDPRGHTALIHDVASGGKFLQGRNGRGGFNSRGGSRYRRMQV